MEYKAIAHNKTNLFFNWYEDKERQHEIDQCLRINKLLFDRVIIVEGRPTFNELFKLSKQYLNDINCYCNSDIYFTDLTRIKQIKPNECFAITREDLINNPNGPGSQDAWCFRGEIKPIEVNFTMGMWGCDNRLAHEIKKAGYEIKNPAMSVKLVHLHKEDKRNYTRTKENTVPPPYLTLPLTT